MRKPENVLFLERMEWGNAVVYPVALEEKGGERIAFEDSRFKSVFKGRMREVNNRRDEIAKLERGQIGKINQSIRKLQMQERYLLRQKTPTDAQKAELDTTKVRLKELMDRYEPLAEKAGFLRAQQHNYTLHFKLPTGEERSQSLGEFVHHYWPNKMGFFSKVHQFFHHLIGFLTGFPREANTEGGIFPSIFGTVVMTLIMSVAVTPFGVLAAIYLREYAKQGLFVRSVRIAVNNLAGVPSIVFGIFGLGFFVYLVGGNIDRLFFPRGVELGVPTFGTGGILWASLTLALMTVPVVIVATEEALAAVSRGVREGALACGASKWQTIQTLVLPASAPGILTGLILAMARGAGEVAPLILVGVVALAPNLPVDSLFPFIHLERKFMHLGFHIYDLGFQSPDSEAAMPMVFATTMVLILLVVVLNLAAILIRNHLRRKYQTSAF
jgi:phosphate transport system permease protein